MAQPILDLSTLAPERETISIQSKLHPKKKVYELNTPDDLTVEENAWLMNHAETLHGLNQKPDAEKTEQEHLETGHLLSKAVKLAVRDLEDEVLAELPRPAQWRLVVVFLMPFVERLAPVAERAKGLDAIATSLTGAR
jgi:hypothetical protein